MYCIIIVSLDHIMMSLEQRLGIYVENEYIFIKIYMTHFVNCYFELVFPT